MLLPLKIEKGDREPRGAVNSASWRRHMLDAVISGEGPLPKLDLSQRGLC